MHPLKILVAGAFTASLIGVLSASTPQKPTVESKPATESIEQLLARHDVATAEKRLNVHLAANPFDVHAMTLFGAMREQQRLYKQAEASYRIALRAKPGYSEPSVALATLLANEERYDDAIAVAEPWHTADPADLAATVMLASLYERRGKYSASLDACESLPASHQLQVLPIVIIDRLMLGQQKEAPPLITELMKHAAERPLLVSELAAGLLRHGMVADAGELLRVVSEGLKPTAPLLSAMAEAEGRQGHLDQARQLAERARHLDEDSTQALVVSAQIEAVQMNWKAAAEYLERVRKVAPPKVTALQNLAYAYVQIPDFDRAHSAALEWYELQPQSTDAAFSLAVVFVGAKHWGEADPLLETVLSRRPNDKAAHLARGIALYNLGKLDEATKQLDASLVQGAPDAVAHYHLGLIAKQRADVPTATKEMEAAIAADPSHQQALSCLGQLYAQQGNLEQARAVLEKAVEMLPEDTQSHYQLATVYRRLSIPEKAREQFELYQRLANKPSANSNK